MKLKPNKNSTLIDINSNISNFGLINLIISIKKIREYFPDINYGDFDFTEVSLEDVKKKC